MKENSQRENGESSYPKKRKDARPYTVGFAPFSSIQRAGANWIANLRLRLTKVEKSERHPR
jgi:hypothetical protein